MNIEDLQEEVDELKQERDELQIELGSQDDELSDREQEGYDRAMIEMEKKIEHAFNAGYEAGHEKEFPFKALLNYQMRQRL